jgi:hypothetical protein
VRISFTVSDRAVVLMCVHHCNRMARTLGQRLRRSLIVWSAVTSIIFLSAILPSVSTISHSSNFSSSYLNPSHWISTLSSTYTVEDVMIPVICEFKEIYVDSLRIYFIPQPSQRREAIEDLFTCCLNTKTSQFLLPRPDDCGGRLSVLYRGISRIPLGSCTIGPSSITPTISL